MTHWWGMHGYAVYIWPAYGLAGVVMMGNAWRARWRSRTVHNQLKQGLKPK
jgi:heme exporter protein CcmD